jgi:hypothetical protein
MERVSIDNVSIEIISIWDWKEVYYFIEGNPTTSFNCKFIFKCGKKVVDLSTT